MHGLDVVDLDEKDGGASSRSGGNELGIRGGKASTSTVLGGKSCELGEGEGEMGGEERGTKLEH